MRPLALRALERRSPTCERRDDEAAVRRYERDVRVHRAYTEAWRVTPPEGPIDGTWEVTGASNTTWRVDLVDGDVLDACDCPDFVDGRVGTCKHLEAVRRAIETRPALRRAVRALGGRARRPTLSVRHDGAGVANLTLSHRVRPQTLRALGITPVGDDGAVTLTDARALRLLDSVRVTAGAMRLAERLHRARMHDARRDEVRREVDEGSLAVDVLKRPLFEYQREGVRHLVSAGRAMLADDMGLGKTIQAIAACEALRRRGEARTVLVVTSASLKDQWAKEIQRWAGETAVVVGGGIKSRTRALQSDAPYRVLNYELTWRELSRLRDLDADVLVLDEAQRAKNFRTRTAKTLREIPSRFLFVLTGTPVENRLDDLYSLMQLVDPEVLGPLWRFNLDFHEQDAKGRVTGYKNLAALRVRLAPVLLRRRRETVLNQLPPLTEQTRYTAMTEAQVELEAGFRADAAQILAIAERRPLTLEETQRALSLLLKARQSCNALELADPEGGERASPKLDEFEALVEEITSQGDAKLLVFSEWTEMLKLAAERLDGIGVRYAMLHGAIATEKRPALLDGFREDPEVRVLLSTDAGGVGLNLQVASYVIHLDLPWNPARLDQRTARSHRMGQSRAVSVFYLCAESGIERGIEQTLRGKRAVRAAALDVDSDVDRVERETFSAFVKQLQAAIEGTDADEVDDEGEGEPMTPEVEATDAEVEEVDEVEVVETVDVVVTEEVATVVTTTAEPATVATERAPRARKGQERLRLARVVLDAGFPADAVRASYEAMRAAVAAMLDGPAPATHAALVAAAYRELIPSGRLAREAHAALARLNDLTALDAEGVEVDASLARAAVDEAEAWVQRLSEGGA